MRQVIKRILTIITLERWVLVSEEDPPGRGPASEVTLASRTHVFEYEPESPPPVGETIDHKGDGA